MIKVALTPVRGPVLPSPSPVPSWRLSDLHYGGSVGRSADDAPVPVVRPCIERLPDGRGCPEYAYDGPRCPEHTREAMRDGTRSPGTTPAWSRARKLALERAGYRCERCGKTDAESRAEGRGGLHVHHVDGRGVRAQEHDQVLLEVRCPNRLESILATQRGVATGTTPRSS